MNKLNYNVAFRISSSNLFFICVCSSSEAESIEVGGFKTFSICFFYIALVKIPDNLVVMLEIVG